MINNCDPRKIWQNIGQNKHKNTDDGEIHEHSYQMSIRIWFQMKTGEEELDAGPSLDKSRYYSVTNRASLECSVTISP